MTNAETGRATPAPSGSTATATGPDAANHRRIAYFTSRFPKATETFVLYEILELERLGHEVAVYPLVLERRELEQPGARRIVESIERPTARRVAAAQVRWLRRRPLRYVRAWFGAIRGNARSPKFLARAFVVVPLAAWFAARLEDRGIDHVHAHWATHPTLAAWVASQLTGIPYSFTGHAHDLFVERPMLAEKLRASRFAVTISDFNRRFLEREYGALARDRVVVVHCGVDPSVFAPGRGPDPSRPLRIVTVASLQPQKGHLVLVAALAELARRDVPFEARFVGEGEERTAIEARIAELGLGGRVRLLGAQPRDAVAAEVRDADLVVQPSIVLPSGKTEGIPVALMEALVAERAVVASDVSGIPELVLDGETGLLAPPGDAGALADAIERLARDPALRQRLGAAGRARVLAQFDLRKNAAELADLIVHEGRRRTDSAA